MTQQTQDGLILIIQARIARGVATPADFIRLASLEGVLR